MLLTVHWCRTFDWNVIWCHWWLHVTYSDTFTKVTVTLNKDTVWNILVFVFVIVPPVIVNINLKANTRDLPQIDFDSFLSLCIVSSLCKSKIYDVWDVLCHVRIARVYFWYCCVTVPTDKSMNHDGFISAEWTATLSAPCRNKTWFGPRNLEIKKGKQYQCSFPNCKHVYRVLWTNWMELIYSKHQCITLCDTNISIQNECLINNVK